MLRIDESWMAEDKRLLTAAGENTSLAAAVEGKNLVIVENEKSWDHCRGIRSLGCMPSYWGIPALRRSSLENIRIFCENESHHHVWGLTVGSFSSAGDFET